MLLLKKPLNLPVTPKDCIRGFVLFRLTFLIKYSLQFIEFELSGAIHIASNEDPFCNLLQSVWYSLIESYEI